MNDDPLDNEVAVSASLTESGFEGKANSRAVSGFDRLLGNVSEFLNAPMEEWISKRRSRIEARREIVKSATQTMVKEVESNPELAERALEGTFDKALRRQENVVSVAFEAAERLKLSPPTKEEAEAGPEEVSEEFLTTFERYAEDACTDELRTKWANVFAAEVKRPGTFGRRAMRIIDEIDSDTAASFAKMSTHRIGGMVPLYLYQPSFGEMSMCVEYGLCQSAFPGISHTPIRMGFTDGVTRFLFFPAARVGVGIQEKDSEQRVKGYGNTDLMQWNDEKKFPVIPIVPILNAGASLLNIMDDTSWANAEKLYLELKKVDPTAILYHLSQSSEDPNSSTVHIIRT